MSAEISPLNVLLEMKLLTCSSRHEFAKGRRPEALSVKWEADWNLNFGAMAVYLILKWPEMECGASIKWLETQFVVKSQSLLIYDKWYNN
jgi:hypothetical protein